MWARIRLNTDTTTERSRRWHRTTEHSNVLCARTTPALFFASSAEAVLSAFTILGAHWAHEWRRSARWATGRFDKRPAAAEPLVGLMQLSAELCQSRSRHTSHLRPTQPLPPPRGGRPLYPPGGHALGPQVTQVGQVGRCRTTGWTDATLRWALSCHAAIDTSLSLNLCIYVWVASRTVWSR